MDDLRTPLRLRDVEWRVIEGETIVLDLQTEQYLSVNAAGTLMWQRLAVGATRDELAGALVEAFAIEQERAQADADAFVESLRGLDLLAPPA